MSDEMERKIEAELYKRYPDGQIILDVSCENAQEYYEIREEMQLKMDQGQLSIEETVDFLLMEAGAKDQALIEESVREERQDLPEEEVNEAVYNICHAKNESLKNQDVVKHLQEIAISSDEPLTLDGDGFFDEMWKRADDSINNANKEKRAKALAEKTKAEKHS